MSRSREQSPKQAARAMVATETPEAPAPARAPEVASWELDVQAIPSYHKGLCMNCDERETCMLPRPESGVWHCEEYK